ncbi:MAG: hypothetical protein KJ630_04190 [Proteobacteria bacterium]|nr:hypothetical protein [Pseudomonadota bacterium]
MPGKNLTTSAVVICPHGGQAQLMTANTQMTADGSAILLETDVHPVVGCPFSVGSKYSPCVRISWSAGSQRVSINGTPPLVASSIGQCFNAEGAVQGVATIVNTQQRTSAQ